MKYGFSFPRILSLVVFFSLSVFAARAQSDVQEVTVKSGDNAQTPAAPLSQQELVKLVFPLQKHPEQRDAVAAEIRRRGLGFPLNDGIRSFVASKSGNDPVIRRTLEEAERRRANPNEKTLKLPSAAEAADVLAHAKQESRAAVEHMPDFVVKQIIARKFALGTSNSWRPNDVLTVAVSYSAQNGEKYKLLAINGIPQPKADEASSSYEEAKGTTSTGEYVTALADLFDDSTHADFRAVDTDTLRNRRTIIYEFSVQRENSKENVRFEKLAPVVVAYHGRIWIDRENFRVLRLESYADNIKDYPITSATRIVDYDWATIAEKKYLLPARADIQLTVAENRQTYQTRNDIRFRGYQKYGTEVRILEDDVVDASEQPAPERKPEPNPEQKP